MLFKKFMDHWLKYLICSLLSIFILDKYKTNMAKVYSSPNLVEYAFSNYSQIMIYHVARVEYHVKSLFLEVYEKMWQITSSCLEFINPTTKIKIFNINLVRQNLSRYNLGNIISRCLDKSCSCTRRSKTSWVSQISY